MNKFVISLCLIASACFVGAAAADEHRQQAQSDILSRRLVIFNNIAKELDANFVDTIDSKKVMDDAVNYYLYQLDPYTQYFPADDRDELEQLSANGYAGIGSSINLRNDSVYISYPYWNSPARKAGLRSGDIILAVDGESAIKPDDVGDVSRRLRGQAGTVVNVDFIRPAVDTTVRHIQIVRDRIPTIALPYAGIVDDNIGYINLTGFSESAGRDFKAALRRLTAQNTLKGLIIDLRGNGGGIVDGAVEIAGTVLPRGTEVVRTRGRATGERIYRTTENPIIPDVPLVVLVDGGTASASEILTGAVQDLDRGVVMGRRTYGKGLVQTTIPVAFDGTLKLTVSKYYLPSGRLIQALDYANRNDDGSPRHTPDSLANEFRTSRGRTVRDGGGISPDITVDEKEVSHPAYKLMSSFALFDFVTRWLAQHPEDTTAVATEQMFEEFKNYVDPKKIDYDNTGKRVTDVVRTSVERSGYEMNDSITACLNRLSALLQRDLPADMDKNKAEIMNLLEMELGQRLLSDADRVQRSLSSDSTVTRAIELLNNPAEYRRLLSAPAGK